MVRTFQNSGIAGLDSQCCDVCDHLRASLEDDQQNTDGATDSL